MWFFSTGSWFTFLPLCFLFGVSVPVLVIVFNGWLFHCHVYWGWLLNSCSYCLLMFNNVGEFLYCSALGTRVKCCCGQGFAGVVIMTRAGSYRSFRLLVYACLGCLHSHGFTGEEDCTLCVVAVKGLG